MIVERRITEILESLPDGFVAADRDRCCCYVNAEAERLLGRTRDELLRADCTELFPELFREGGAALNEHPDRAAADNPTVEFQRHDEASARCIEARARRDRDGGLAIYLRDVTDRVRAEVELRRSQRELMDFFENATEGLHWVGPDGTILWANQAELDLLGYTREEYLGHCIKEFHVDPHVIDDVLARLVAGEDLKNREARLRCKDGSIRYVLISSNALSFEGQFIHTRCFTRDITARKRAEEELQASQQLFARFMENLPGLAWMKDLQGRYVYVNAAGAEAFRSSPEALYGKQDSDIFPADTAAEYRENDQRALASEHGVLVVEKLEHEDGVLHHSLVSKFPVVDPDGRVIAVGGMAIDITERTRAEEALRAADRRKDEFLAMLAHELRNPLAPIVTAVEILSIRGTQDPILQKQRDVIKRQVEQMKRLLDDLLDVSRITRGKVQLAITRVDLSTILTHAVETSRPLIDERGHHLEVSLPAVPLQAEGDAARLSQVFTNLLNNAARYTPPGGHVWFTAERDGGTARIRVRDTGIGMTPDVIAGAFELFAQGERSLARSEGGLGIGLTLVRELVELHGGTVTAQSAGVDQGSEFVVTLPLLDAPRKHGRPEP